MRSWWLWACLAVGCSRYEYAADIEQTLTHPMPRDAPASERFVQQPWHVGQWTLYRRFDSDGTSFVRESVVAQDSCGLWIETVNERSTDRETWWSCWREQPDPRHPDVALDSLQVVITKSNDDAPDTLDFRQGKHAAEKLAFRDFAIDMANPWNNSKPLCPTMIGLPVAIESVPPGANVYLGDTSCPIGKTPFAGALPFGTATIVIDLPGYAPVTRSFSVAVPDKNVLAVELAPLDHPLPPAPAAVEFPDREDVRVAAGTFAKAARTQVGSELRWVHPEVPIRGIVKAMRAGQETELVGYGQTGARSALPVIAGNTRQGVRRFLQATAGGGSITFDAGGSETGTSFGIETGLSVSETFDVVIDGLAMYGIPDAANGSSRTPNVLQLGARWTPARHRTRVPARVFDPTVLYLQANVGAGWIGGDGHVTVGGAAGWLPLQMPGWSFGIEVRDNLLLSHPDNWLSIQAAVQVLL